MPTPKVQLSLMRVDNDTSGIILVSLALVFDDGVPGLLTSDVAFTEGLNKVPPMANSVPCDLPINAGLVRAFSEPKKAAVPVPPNARDCAPRPIRWSPLVASTGCEIIALAVMASASLVFFIVVYPFLVIFCNRFLFTRDVSR